MGVIISQEEILKCARTESCIENDIIQKFGEEKGSEILSLLTNYAEIDANNKLNLPIMYCYSKQREKGAGCLPKFFTIEAYAENSELIARIDYRIYPNLRSARLCYIAILSDNGKYQGIGIGHELLTRLENVFRAIGVEYFDGHFCPLGNYQNHSRKFYERHGFSFYVDYETHGKHMIEKHLEM